MIGSPRLISDVIAQELRGYFDRYGPGPDFWNAYQRIMQCVAEDCGNLVELANEMAGIAEGLGAVRHAELVSPRLHCVPSRRREAA